MQLAWSVLLVMALLASPRARADDACLAGAATLDDQRAVAAFRAALETSCPCEAAVRRGAYRRCAKNVVKTAVGDGTVRGACEDTAKQLVKGATCGTKLVACGRVTPAGDPATGCAVRRAKSCKDRKRFTQEACHDESFCADVVDWTAGTCSDVRVRGPFEAGVRVIRMTKTSVAHPPDPRVLDTVVWYPTTPGAGPLSTAYNAVVDAPIDASGGPYPILMFSHGSCGYANQSTFLLPLVAARGYVVVATPHPGNTIFEFPACGTPSVQFDSALERPNDIIFALDQMLAASGDPASPFFGVLDPSRVGMSGHSFGGFTTYLVVAADSRFRVALPMAPAVPGSPVLPVPSLSMISSEDSVVNNQATRDAYALATSPKYLVELAHTGHYAYSNLCFPSPDCNPPVTLTQDEAHEAVERWVIPFLERYLRGDETFAAFFAASVPGATLTVD